MKTDKTLQLLAQYAAYHLRRGNVLTHMVGIPMIVFAVVLLVALLPLHVGVVPLAAACVWTLARMGVSLLSVATCVVYVVMYGLAQGLAARPHAAAWGVGIFVVGWMLQFVGHLLEKRKPAFADDLKGLLIGPVFVMAELLFALGWNAALQQRMLQEARAQRAQADAARAGGAGSAAST